MSSTIVGYLMTYGDAIGIILIVAGVLFYCGVLVPSGVLKQPQNGWLIAARVQSKIYQFSAIHIQQTEYNKNPDGTTPVGLLEKLTRIEILQIMQMKGCKL